MDETPGFGDVSTNVDFAAFDVTVDGMVTGEMGPVDHRIRQRLPRPGEGLCPQGATLDTAELVHDAQRIIHDRRRLTEGVAVTQKRGKDLDKRTWVVLIERGLRGKGKLS